MDNFTRWFEENEETLREDYIKYLTEKGDLFDSVFFFDCDWKWANNIERLKKAAEAADRAWNDYVVERYDEVAAMEMEPEDLPGSDR